MCGPGSSVGIATGYGLNGPGIESRWGPDFLHLSRLALGPAQPPVKWVLSLLPGGKGAGAWCFPPTQVNRAELYLHVPSGPSRLVLGWALPLHYVIFILSSYYITQTSRHRSVLASFSSVINNSYCKSWHVTTESTPWTTITKHAIF